MNQILCLSILFFIELCGQAVEKLIIRIISGMLTTICDPYIKYIRHLYVTPVSIISQ